MADLIEIAARLPPQAQHELLHFAEFLQERYAAESWPEDHDWRKISKSSLVKVWNNTEDDVYAALL